MVQMIDAHETAFRQFWAGSSEGTGLERQNYFNPQKAVNIQYGWAKPKFDTRPQTSAGITRDLFKNTEPFGKDVLKFNMLDEQLALDTPPKRPEYREYTAPPTPAMYPIPNVGRPTQYYGALDWLKNLLAKLKDFFLNILAKIGLYQPPAPAPPPKTDVVNNKLTPRKDITPTIEAKTTAKQTSFDRFYAASREQMYSGPFDDHTVIFSREVVP